MFAGKCFGSRSQNPNVERGLADLIPLLFPEEIQRWDVFAWGNIPK